MSENDNEARDVSLNIFKRIAAVMAEVDYIQKEKKPGMRYSIVSHDAVTAKIRPVLVKHGIVYYPHELALRQNGNRTECEMTVRFVNIDEPNEFMDVRSAGYGIDDQDKGPGKAISYAVKYALLKGFGLESGDEPDEDQVTQHETTLVTSLKAVINMTKDAAELEAATLPKIMASLGEMTPAQAQLVRSHYAQRKKALEQEAAESETPKGRRSK